MKASGIQVITDKNTFIISFIVIMLTIFGIWLFGLGQQRSIYENSILSTSKLAIAFFLFLSTGLYKGVAFKVFIGSMRDDKGKEEVTGIILKQIKKFQANFPGETQLEQV